VNRLLTDEQKKASVIDVDLTGLHFPDAPSGLTFCSPLVTKLVHQDKDHPLVTLEAWVVGAADYDFPVLQEIVEGGLRNGMRIWLDRPGRAEGLLLYAAGLLQIIDDRLAVHFLLLHPRGIRPHVFCRPERRLAFDVPYIHTYTVFNEHFYNSISAVDKRLTRGSILSFIT